MVEIPAVDFSSRYLLRRMNLRITLIRGLKEVAENVRRVYSISDLCGIRFRCAQRFQRGNPDQILSDITNTTALVFLEARTVRNSYGSRVR